MGQFIYASVVIKFISNANQDPAKQLQIVLGLRPSGSFTPFAQLDALYQHIFSQVVDIEVASLLLAAKMFTVRKHLPILAHAGRIIAMTTNEKKVAMAALTPVLTYNSLDDTVKFLHASLPDFLMDQHRSQAYHIDRATWSTKLTILVMQFIINKISNKLVESNNQQNLNEPRLYGEHPMCWKIHVNCTY